MLPAKNALSALALLLAAWIPALPQGDAPVKVKVNGVELAYIERGTGEPVVLLHGGQADYRAWQHAMDTLSRSYRVISYSRRYNYPNDNPIKGNNHSAYIEADDLEAFIKKLRLGRVHLVGTSIGAYAALIYAVRHPARVVTLSLAEPNIHAWVLSTPSFKTFFQNTWIPARNAFVANEDERAMSLLNEGFGGPGAWNRTSPASRASAMQNARFFRAATLSKVHSPDISKSKVSRLKIPVLLVNGEHTPEMLRSIVEEFAKVLPSAERHIVKGAGHGSPREKPEDFTSAVAAFIARH
jgi:non-heme chloroperoxidase